MQRFQRQYVVNIQDFTVLKTLGRGGFGTVFLARKAYPALSSPDQEQTQGQSVPYRLYAIKVYIVFQFQ